MNYKDLYKPVFYCDDAKVDIFSQHRGFIKRKVQGIRDVLGFNQGSVKTFFCYQQRGRYLCFYSDLVKKGGELLGLLKMSGVTDVIDEVKGKVGHFMIKTSTEELHLKCDEAKEAAEWIKTIKFFKNYYKNESNNESTAIIQDIDVETRVNLQAEIELENWDPNDTKFDYSGFIKDKGLSILFENNILEIMKNRLLISCAQKETKQKKGASINEPQTPTTPMNHVKQLDMFNLNVLSGTHYYFVMICQRPINIIDQEFALTDYVILNKESLPDWMNFNILYYFEYTGRGDFSNAKKSFDVS